MSTKKDVYSQAVSKLGSSKLFLAAVLLDLLSVLISSILFVLNIVTIIKDSQRVGDVNLFSPIYIIGLITLIVSALMGIALFRVYISFKRDEPNTKALNRVILYAIIHTVLSAATFFITYRSVVPYFFISFVLLNVISILIIIGERNTLKLAIAFSEQDLAGILKYKSSVLLLVFILYTIVYELLLALTTASIYTLLSIPGIASLVLYCILLFKFRVIANTGTKKANRNSERSPKQIDL